MVRRRRRGNRPRAADLPRIEGHQEGDLSRFVDDAVQARLFELTVQGVKDRNRPFSQTEILDAIDEAMS